MVNSTAPADWREARRRSARATIVEAAWEAVREDGLAALSLRDLARRAGITTPTVYAYFASKNDIYDAMFEEAATEFELHITAPYGTDDPEEFLRQSVRRFVDFCTGDHARYHLLFQRTIPGFEPSPASYAPAVRTADHLRQALAQAGVTDQRHIDMWTAWSTGVVDQQISNDPGGDRWSRLIDDFVSMFLAHCLPAEPTGPTSDRPARRRTRPNRERS
jgi:AcrR family transcriptional regulator